MESNESRERTTYYNNNSYPSESSSESREETNYSVANSSNRTKVLEQEIKDLQEQLRLQRELDELDNRRQQVLQKIKKNRR